MQQVLFALGFVLLAACSRAPAPLVSSYDIVGDALPIALTETPGDAVRGRAIFEGRSFGHCVLCHQVAMLDAPFQGDIGPALDDVGARFSTAQIRLRIVDASIVNPQTIMPPYYRTENLHQVGEEYQGQTALTAQEIEDLVAWLSQRKG